jgi:hypothetical protein
MPDIFREILPSILNGKEKVLFEPKEYNPFVINRALSSYYDCIILTNLMNSMPHIDRQMQYDFLFHSVRKYKRPFSKWVKKETTDNLRIIKEYYKYSNEKAAMALSVLSEDEISEITKRIDKGGVGDDKHRENE